MGHNSKKRVRRNTTVLDSSSNQVNTALLRSNTVITTSSPNCSNAMFTPIIQVDDILSDNSELRNLACVVSDIQRQIDEIQAKLGLLVGIQKSVSNIVELHSDSEQVKSPLDVTEKKLAALDPLACLLEKDHELVPDNLNKVENLIDCLAIEVMKRISSSHQAIVYNLPDSVPLKTIRKKVLSCCGMINLACECRRLRKKSTQSTCPIIFQFSNPIDASNFIKLQEQLRLKSSYKSVTIAQDRTPCQRRIMRSGNLVTSPGTNSSKVESVPKQLASVDSNIEQTAQPSCLPVQLDVDLDISIPISKSAPKNSKIASTVGCSNKKVLYERSKHTTTYKLRRVESNSGKEYFIFNEHTEKRRANIPTPNAGEITTNTYMGGAFQKASSEHFVFKNPSIRHPKQHPPTFYSGHRNKYTHSGTLNNRLMQKSYSSVPHYTYNNPIHHHPYIQEPMINFVGVPHHWYDPWHLALARQAATPMNGYLTRPSFHP